MTIVKIQRPIHSQDRDGKPVTNGPWLVYDKYNARQSLHDEVPLSIQRVFDAAPKESTGYFKQYFDGAEWNDIFEKWDLDDCAPITRRLIW